MTKTEPQPIGESQATPPNRTGEEPGMSTLAVGFVLIVIGAVLFAGQLLDVGIEDVGWPFFVIAAGAVVLLIGMVIAGEQGMVIGGTIATTVGLVLLYQNSTGRWESWAYAWALVGPAASGLGLALWGVRSGNAADVRNGTWGLLGGLGLFVIGFLFFEGVIGIGAVVLGRGLLERREA
jgi:hypothetical protein